MKTKNNGGFTFIELNGVLLLVILMLVTIGYFADKHRTAEFNKGYDAAQTELTQKFNDHQTTISKVVDIGTAVSGGKFVTAWKKFRMENGDTLTEYNIVNEDPDFIKEGDYIEYTKATNAFDQNTYVRAVVLPKNYTPKKP